MYGGKFLPFHLGHQYCVEVAAQECETVYVIMFWGSVDEEQILKEHPENWLSLEERVRQLHRICQSLGTIATISPALIDISKLRYPDGSEDWDAETPLVRKLVGNQLDAVYSSEESYGDYFRKAYPEALHRLVDIKRVHFPISSTLIREMSDSNARNKWMI